MPIVDKTETNPIRNNREVSEANEISNGAGTKFRLNCAYLYLSTYCNLKCRHCWINPHFSPEKALKNDELNMKTLIAALEECRELGMSSIKLTGGEPFLRKDIFDILEYGEKKGFNIIVLTNGTFLLTSMIMMAH